MKLKGATIRGFRSISETILPEVGVLNVLIGKNNSGKSTILFAIDTFFSCIEDGRVVSLDPPIGRPIDFHGQDLNRPLEIALRFGLDEIEATSLHTSILEVTPQLRTAVEGLGKTLELSATLAIVPGPQRFSYVKTLELHLPDPNFPPRQILHIGREAAYELADRQRTVRSSQEIIATADRMLRVFDEEDFRRTKAQESESRALRFSYLTRRFAGEVSAETLAVLEDLTRNSATFAEMKSNLTNLKGEVRGEIQRAQNEPITKAVHTFSGEQLYVPFYALATVTKLSEMKVLYLTERREPVGRPEATQLLSYKVTRGGTETLRQLQHTIFTLLGVQVDAFESPHPGNTGRSGEMDVDNFLLEVNGSGIKEALRLILDVEFRKPDLLLVEEPEVHLHPGLETNMMRYLRKKSESCQIFLSTHSTNFIDTLEMKNVYFVSKLSSKTEVQLLSAAEAEAVIPKELGLRLSSLFMFDRLVFVEGPTDEAVFREFAATLNVNLSHANVGFIHLGGVRNFTHYATEVIFNFLTKRQVRLWFLLDRDERDEAEVEKIRNRFANKASINFLEKRELENYLIRPRALTEFIAWKQAQRGEVYSVDIDRVNAAVTDAAARLKGLTVAKKVAKTISFPVYPKVDWNSIETDESVQTKLSEGFASMHASIAEAEGRIPSTVTVCKARLERDWSQNKLDLVPGDVLLDLVCKDFGVRFKKEADSARLAAMITADEIEQHLVQLIKQIGS